MTTTRPFMPSERPRLGISVERAIVAAARAAITPAQRDPVKHLRQNDQVASWVLRSPVSPADATTAAALVGNAVDDFVASLAPMSAYARLANVGLRVGLLNGRSFVTLPRRQGAKAVGNVTWTASGARIAARQFTADGAQLGPLCKLGLVAGLTRETAELGGDQVISTLVKEDVAASLDATAFSNSAAVEGVSPAGLLYNVTPITASTATDKGAAMLEDLENLAGTVADNGGSGNIVFVASPKQAASARLRLLTDAIVWPCAALAAGTICALDPLAFVCAFGPEPSVSASIEATVHFETSPTQLSTIGTPNIFAAPTLSAFQQDLVVIRCTLDVAYTMRQANMVAVVESVGWGGPAGA